MCSTTPLYYPFRGGPNDLVTGPLNSSTTIHSVTEADIGPSTTAITNADQTEFLENAMSPLFERMLTIKMIQNLMFAVYPNALTVLLEELQKEQSAGTSPHRHSEAREIGAPIVHAPCSTPSECPCSTPSECSLKIRIRPCAIQPMSTFKRTLSAFFPRRRHRVHHMSDEEFVVEIHSFEEVVCAGGPGFPILSFVDQNENTIEFPQCKYPG
ncbi:unnamed protein product [Caenorhabditis sp. 36 PRJEB53466]|nr:unnamed protein product [Caenorhabditis sp. 36 PRJEB53466]